MGQALYRKYRSKSLSEIVGQEHVTETLRRAIESGKVSHAYLFTGPRGVGKTSIARILAHDLNGVPYTGEDNHLDIIEIDAASNGGVEEIRDLRDKVYITPSSGKYKVYIIDEVHMMTTSAFNALLKTLEEPPAHTIFILATTEAHKIPATILSRTQRFTFKPIPSAQMVAHLRHIADEEQITVDDTALALIAEHSEGSFRDAISLLDQAGSAGQPIDSSTVESLLGLPPATVIANLLESLQRQEAGQAVTQLVAAKRAGYQPSLIARQLGQQLRAALIEGQSLLPKETVLPLLARLIDVPSSPRPDQMLEIALLTAALPDTPVAAPAPAPMPAAAPRPLPTAPVASAPPVPTPVVLAQPEPADDDNAASTHLIDTAIWQSFLDTLKKQYNTLYGIVRMAQPEFTPGRVKLTFGFAFHQKRANDPKNKKVMTGTLESLTGHKIAIDCAFDGTVTPPAPMAAHSPAAVAAPPAPSDPSLASVTAIFGGGEVVQP